MLGAEPFLVDVLRFGRAEIFEVDSFRLDPTRFLSSKTLRFLSSKVLCFLSSKVLCFQARCLSCEVFGFDAICLKTLCFETLCFEALSFQPLCFEACGFFGGEAFCFEALDRKSVV